MDIQIGDLVEAISTVDDKTVRRGVVTAFFDNDIIRVDGNNFSTLCRKYKKIALSSFDLNQRWWIEKRRAELSGGENGRDTSLRQDNSDA